MTREEAIRKLQKQKADYLEEWVDYSGVAEAYDMAIEALSAEAEQGVGRYENAMQKLREMPRYLNGVKKKQITKISANYTTEKPNDIVEQKNDVVAEPTDLISRADAIEAVRKRLLGSPVSVLYYTQQKLQDWGGYAFEEHREGLYEAIDVLESLPSADRPSGEWQDKEVFNETDDDHIVDEWQSARCSVCGKYHTTPYMYYFDNFNYCPNCGAEMKGEKL